MNISIIKRKVKILTQDLLYNILKKNYVDNNPFLKKEQLEDFEKFYNDGFENFGILDKHNKVLEKISKFIDSNNYEKKFCNVEDKFHTLFDNNGYLWRINNGQSLKECLLYNDNHPFFKSRYKEVYKKDKCDSYYEFLRNNASIKTEIFNSKNQKLVNKIFTDENFQQPFSIKIQKKGHSNLANNANENYIHIDTMNANYKFYIYLNEVTESLGPMQIQRGTHHWNIHEELKKIKIFNRNKFFNKNSPEIKKLLKNEFEKILLKAGSCFGFFGSLLHSATNVDKGNFRYTIQAYYEIDKPWSTDKLNS